MSQLHNLINIALKEKLQIDLGDSSVELRTLSGGDINDTYAVKIQGKENYVIKTNRTFRKQFFASESAGLKLLNNTLEKAGQKESLRVPEAIAYQDGQEFSYLILSWIPIGNVNQKKRELDLAHSLAYMHACQTDANRYGFDHHNYCGLSPQRNSWHEKWNEFFITERLTFQLEMLKAKGIADKNMLTTFAKASKNILSLLPESPPISVLHGDLWQGNKLYSSNGINYLIDPAVYYGHNETDLAFSRLFGGFSPDFYAAYAEIFPLEQNWQDRFNIYNCYHLLNHANIFHSTSYAEQAKRHLLQFQ